MYHPSWLVGVKYICRIFFVLLSLLILCLFIKTLVITQARRHRNCLQDTFNNDNNKKKEIPETNDIETHFHFLVIKKSSTTQCN